MLPMLLLTHTPAMFNAYYGDAALQRLRGLVQIRRYDGDQPMGSAELIRLASDCDIIVSDRATPGEAAVFSALPKLTAFLRCAVDIRTIDVDAASANGVLVTRATPGFISAVNEWILGVMIDLARGISRATHDYHRGKEPVAQMGIQLSGSTLGVVGYGSIGARLAVLGQQIGMRVLAYDPHVQSMPDGVEPVEFHQLLSQSDFVVCLVVANERTENLFDASAFSWMKPTAFFINAARGNLVDETALITTLENGAIAGAAIDVGRALDQMPSRALAKLNSVIATPHIGGLTKQAVAHQALDTVNQVAALVTGNVPAGAVNADHATRMWRFFRSDSL